MKRILVEIFGLALATSLTTSCSSTNGSPSTATDGGKGQTSSGTATSPSCKVSAPGTTNCGAAHESCCTSPEITGGTYSRTYMSNGMATGLADPATISSFRLDKYAVTVGRFRQFVAAWNGGWMPAAGSGKHTHLNGGKGLSDSATPGMYETGWVAADDAHIAPSDANLGADLAYSTWTSTAGSQESLPINEVDWAEAYAFCIWDGGFLPTEAEWQYAVAGGSQQREYPWGTTAPGTGNQYAIFGCNYPKGTGVCAMGLADIAPVGSATLGAGLWGQLDLVGNMAQWILDLSNPTYVDPCTDCGYLTAPPFTNRVIRGGSFGVDVSNLLPRDDDNPTNRNNYIGFRCARAP